MEYYLLAITSIMSSWLLSVVGTFIISIFSNEKTELKNLLKVI